MWKLLICLPDEIPETDHSATTNCFVYTNVNDLLGKRVERFRAAPRHSDYERLAGWNGLYDFLGDSEDSFNVHVQQGLDFLREIDVNSPMSKCVNTYDRINWHITISLRDFIGLNKENHWIIKQGEVVHPAWVDEVDRFFASLPASQRKAFREHRSSGHMPSEGIRALHNTAKPTIFDTIWYELDMASQSDVIELVKNPEAKTQLDPVLEALAFGQRTQHGEWKWLLDLFSEYVYYYHTFAGICHRIFFGQVLSGIEDLRRPVVRTWRAHADIAPLALACLFALGAMLLALSGHLWFSFVPLIACVIILAMTFKPSTLKVNYRIILVIWLFLCGLVILIVLKRFWFDEKRTYASTDEGDFIELSHPHWISAGDEILMQVTVGCTASCLSSQRLNVKLTLVSTELEFTGTTSGQDDKNLQGTQEWVLEFPRSGAWGNDNADTQIIEIAMFPRRRTNDVISPSVVEPFINATIIPDSPPCLSGDYTSPQPLAPYVPIIFSMSDAAGREASISESCIEVFPRNVPVIGGLLGSIDIAWSLHPLLLGTILILIQVCVEIVIVKLLERWFKSS